jgi:hypothetical protein
MRFETLRLLDMKELEVAKSCRGLEAVQCFGDRVDRRVAATLRLLEIEEILALDPLVGSMDFLHGSRSRPGVTI